MYKGKSHAQGGIPVVVDGNTNVEIEGNEYHICRDAMSSAKIYSFKNKSNKEILDSIYSSEGCKFVQGIANSGDFIVCKLVVLDDTKRTITGTVKSIIDTMQSEKSCNVSEGGSKMEMGGGIPNSNIEKFMQWYKDWYKGVADKMNILISLPSIIAPFKEDNVVILDLFEKIDQTIDAKPYLKDIVDKADEYDVTIYLEPTPRYKFFLKNTEKRTKISKDYLITYYEKFDFKLTTNGQFMKRLPINKMEKGGGINKLAFIKKYENGFYWLYTINDKGENEQIDGDRRLYVVKDMAKRWGYKLVSKEKINQYYNFKKQDKMEKGGQINECLSYIKTNKETILANGYCHYFRSLPILKDVYAHVNEPAYLSDLQFLLITYNSGGQTNLKITDNVNSFSLRNEIKKLLGCSDGLAKNIVIKYLNSAKKVDETTFETYKDEKIMIANRDEIVCQNVVDEMEKGGKVKKAIFDIQEEDERITISIKGIGKVILTETYPKYEFSEDISEDELEELEVDEEDMIGKIEHIQIEDKYKGQGYAKLLMNKAIEIAEEKGLMPLYLNASPMGTKGLNIVNLTSFYESFGFEVFLKQGNNNLMILKSKVSYEKGGSIDEHKETYQKWKSLVNMSKSELKEFYDSQEGKDAGLSDKESNDLGISNGRESARWIMRMKDTTVSNWTPKMWEWAKKQISFISRMSGNKGSLYDDKGNKTRKHTSLLIWGHNPKKMGNGGEIKDLIVSKKVELNFYRTFPDHALEYGVEAENPLYLKNFHVTKSERLKGIGKNMLKYLDDYAIENGNDVIFGHISQKATFTKNKETNLNDTQLIKNWLHDNGYAVNDDDNNFHKVVGAKMKDGGEIIPQQGTLFTKDKTSKLEYKKVGNDYVFRVYNPKESQELKMSKNQFINYLHSELYIDDKMKDGGSIEYYPKGTIFQTPSGEIEIAEIVKEEQFKNGKPRGTGYRLKGSSIMTTFDEVERNLKKGIWTISMKDGGNVITYRNKFNRKYGFYLNESHSLEEIAKLTSLKLSSLQDIYDKGIGAYKTNPASVRPNVKSKEQWAMARVYSAVMGGKASKVDANELKRGKMEDGGEIDNLFELITYTVTIDTNSTTDEEYSGFDEEKAIKVFNGLGANDLPTNSINYGGFCSLYKKVDKYKFVYELDKEYDEEISDYPIEEYYDDKNYYKLVEEGENEIIEHRDIAGANDESNNLLDEITGYYHDKYGNFKYNTIQVYADSDIEQDEPIGCIQLRIADHTENINNVDRFGRCDFYISVVVADNDVTRNRFGMSNSFDRRSNEVEILVNSRDTFNDAIDRIQEEIVNAIEYVKLNSDDNTMEKGGNITGIKYQKNLDELLKQEGWTISYWDKNINDVPKEKAYEMSLFKFDPNYESIRIKLPSKMEVTFEWIMNKVNKDKVYKSFTENFNKILKQKGLSNINAYPTTYGIGVSVFAGMHISETKKNIENLLNSLEINYTTEYSDENYVFRYKISKSKENIEKIEKLETTMAKGGNIPNSNIELLAPNGNKSNLTSKQWHIVRTPAFKQWFGDWEKLAMAKIKDSAMDEVTLANISKDVSKVVDENGEPLVVYHGSRQVDENTKFNVFNVGNGAYGQGIYFTPDKKEADGWALGNYVYQVFLSVKNPFIENNYKKWLPHKTQSNEFDGIIQMDLNDFSMLIAFEPNQIKLATGENTTFNGDNDDIRYEDGGEIESHENLESQIMKQQFGK